MFRLIEDLITGLGPAGYILVQHADNDKVDTVTDRLVQALVQHFAAPDFYLKRIRDLLSYYQKPVDDVATGVRAQEVDRLTVDMSLAFRELSARSDKALNP